MRWDLRCAGAHDRPIPGEDDDDDEHHSSEIQQPAEDADSAQLDQPPPLDAAGKPRRRWYECGDVPVRLLVWTFQLSYLFPC